MTFSAAVVAKHLDGEVVGDAQIELSGFAPADRAQSGDLTFAENDEFFARADQTAASAIIVNGDKISSTGKILIRVANPRVAFAKALALSPIVPAGVLIGRRLHDRLPQQQLYSLCYVLVGLAGLKLLWDASRALLTA